MVEESIKSIKAELYDRVLSPLIFGFCIAWCVWNYKFFKLTNGHLHDKLAADSIFLAYRHFGKELQARNGIPMFSPFLGIRSTNGEEHLGH